jgi:ATP-dependent RNA helicase DeaD
MTSTPTDFDEILGPAFAGALKQKGYESLTPVQWAVLDPALAGRDLRITSQTGSGKTVAIGFALRELVEGSPRRPGVAKPVAIVVAPTRELAKQVEQELAWLFAPLGAHIASATGGAAYGDERRALSKGPAIIVGTPGRLLDHLERKVIDPSDVATIVLDEADRMLDLGFREELEAILGHAPPGHRTLLTSATFPRGVKSLADRIQTNPAHVEGTPLGAANSDIDHVIHLVDPRDRVNAIVNLLLANPDEQTLVFCRTRADVASFAKQLREAGFGVSSISGEMEQPARNRALADFREGKLRALIATDVAARGIDVQDILRVIHADPPNDADTYTHRSGRTGRAGRKGTSSVLVSPSAVSRTTMVLQRARVAFRIEPIPTRDQILEGRSESAFEDLTRDSDDDFAPPVRALAERLATASDVTRVLARLLSRAHVNGPTEPRAVREITPPERGRAAALPTRERPAAGEARAPGGQRQRGNWVPFRVSWGEEQGADARRLLPIVCRRGDIRGNQVGSIRVARRYSVVEIAEEVADAFEAAAQQPDPRDPRIVISRDRGQATNTYRDATAAERPSREETPDPRAARPAPAASGGSGPRPTAGTPDAAANRARAREPRAHAETDRAVAPRATAPSRRVTPRDVPPSPRPPRQDDAPIARIAHRLGLEAPNDTAKKREHARPARAPHDTSPKREYARPADTRPRESAGTSRPRESAGTSRPPARRDRPGSPPGRRFPDGPRARAAAPAKPSERLDLSAKPPKRRYVVTSEPESKARGPKRKSGA